MPSIVTDYIWKNCYSNDNINNNISTQKLVDCESPISEEQNQRILDNIKSDQETLWSLRFWYSTQTSALQFLPTNRETAIELRQNVQQELNSFQ